MRRFVSLILFVVLIVSCSQDNHESVSDILGARLAVNASVDDDGALVGVANKDTFEKNVVFKNWFTTKYKACQLNKFKTDSLKLFLNEFEIKAFIGTWCPDSRRELPRFYRVMDEIGCKEFDMICLNREKTAEGLEKGFDVKYVPTFIVYKQGKEVGRFIESSTTGSLESDLLAIVQQKNYKPSR